MEPPTPPPPPRDPATERLDLAGGPPDSGGVTDPVEPPPDGGAVTVPRPVPAVPSFSLAQVRPFLDHVLAGALGALAACAASLWMWSDGIGEQITGKTALGIKLGDVRKVVFVMLFWAVFSAIYAGCLAAASRERSPIRAGFAGFGLGALGGLAGALLRYPPTSDNVGLVLCLAVVGLAVGAVGAFGAGSVQRAWSVVAGLAGGLIAGWLLVGAWNPPGFDSFGVDVVLALVIAIAVGAAAHLTGRRSQ
jgi:hypothetical protein